MRSVPGVSRLAAQGFNGELHGEPALARAVTRHRCPDVSFSVVFQLTHLWHHRNVPGTRHAHYVVAGRWGYHLLLPGTDRLSVRRHTAGHLHRFSSGHSAFGCSGNRKKRGSARLLCATYPVDAATVRDLHHPCLLSACRLRRGYPLHARAASLGGLALYCLRPGWPGVSGFHRWECPSLSPSPDADRDWRAAPAATVSDSI